MKNMAARIGSVGRPTDKRAQDSVTGEADRVRHDTDSVQNRSFPIAAVTAALVHDAGYLDALSAARWDTDGGKGKLRR